MNRLIYSNWRPPGKARLAGRGIPDWNRSNAKERTRKRTTKRKWNDEEEEEQMHRDYFGGKSKSSKILSGEEKIIQRRVAKHRGRNCNGKIIIVKGKQIKLGSRLAAKLTCTIIRNGSIILVKYILAPYRCRQLKWRSRRIEVTDSTD